MCVCDDDYVNGIDCSAWKEKTKWNNTSLRKMMVFSKLWQQVPPTLCNKSWKWIFVNLMIEFSVCWAIAVKWMYSLISQIDSDIGKFEASTFLRSTCTMCYTVHTHTYIYIHLFNTHEKLHFEFSTHKMFDDFRSRSFFLILLLFSLRIRACHFVTFIRFASTSKAWGMGSMHVALCPAFTSAIWFRE